MLKENCLLFIISFLIIFSILYVPKLEIPRVETPEIQLYFSEEDKAKMFDEVFFWIDDYFNQTISTPKFLNKQFDYTNVFVTIFVNGQVTGCQSSSTRNISKDLKEATIHSIKDNRFTIQLQKEHLDNITLEITFLFNKIKLENNNLNYLKNNIETGINAIQIQQGKNSASFKESVPIEHNFDFETNFQKLCEKANLNKTCYLENATTIYKYDTITFETDRSKKINDLYRYNLLVDEKDVTKENIDKRLELAKSWFLVNEDPNTFLKYEYLPSSDRYSTGNNSIRQMATLHTVTKLYKHSNDPKIYNLSVKGINHFLSFLKYDKQRNIYFIEINNESTIAHSGFLILSLAEIEDFPNRTFYLKSLSDGILSLQNSDGSFKTLFNSDKVEGIDYYPGEAMLALMTLYQHTGDKNILDSVARSFDYYSSYWRSNKNMAFVPWYTEAYFILFNATNNKTYKEFIFEMNDWMIDNYQIMSSRYPDTVGGFPKKDPVFSTSVFLEGVNDAYKLAKDTNDPRKDKYERSIRLGTRFIFQTQFTPENTFYIRNPSLAIGGFKQSLTRNNIRIDFLQHAVSSMLKTRDYLFN
jgi:AMMECR1 domain-containing protein